MKTSALAVAIAMTTMIISPNTYDKAFAQDSNSNVVTQPGYLLTVNVPSHPFGSSTVGISITTENGYTDQANIPTVGNPSWTFNIPPNQGNSVQVCVNSGALSEENCHIYKTTGSAMSVSIPAISVSSNNSGGSESSNSKSNDNNNDINKSHHHDSSTNTNNRLNNHNDHHNSSTDNSNDNGGGSGNGQHGTDRHREFGRGNGFNENQGDSFNGISSAGSNHSFNGNNHHGFGGSGNDSLGSNSHRNSNSDTNNNNNPEVPMVQFIGPIQ